MKHLFVPYSIALALKEKGFDEECLARYHNVSWEFILEHTLTYKNYDYPVIQAPIYQQVVDWFREKYGIHIEIVTRGEDHEYPKWQYWLVNVKQSNRIELALKELEGEINDEFTDYYEALTAAIEYSLTLIP